IDEWLPDRCMSVNTLLNPKNLSLEQGCPSLSTHCEKFSPGSRKKLEALYCDVISRFGCCGFIAWFGEQVIGYNNFFPRKIAKDIRFYGWGNDDDRDPSTLVHNCISITRNSKYRRRGIGIDLMTHSLQWAKDNGWKRFEVHKVLPSNSNGISSEQKSGQIFWEKLGFKVFRTEEACNETKRMYGVSERYSMVLELESWDGTS
ncbi:MAG: GNAT family N-acetyltransferase, partial [Promethearchaeota archaeon]